MTDKAKPTEQELQEWLDKVHFGSCCSDPLVSDNQKEGGKDNTKKSNVAENNQANKKSRDSI